MGRWGRVALGAALWLSSGSASAEPGRALRGLTVSLRLVHVASETANVTSGFLLLRVPLERTVAPTRNELAVPVESPADEPIEREPESKTEASTAVGQPSAATYEAPPRLVLTPSLVRATLIAAQRASRDVSSAERLDSLASRAKSAALLPELGLRAARSTDETLRAAPTIDDPYRYTATGGADLAFEVRATWHLDRLVFADEELSVERLRNESEKARQKLREQVLAKLFAWQRALLRAASEGLPPEERAEAELLALEAELELDVLTAGWFSTQLAKGRGAE